MSERLRERIARLVALAPAESSEIGWRNTLIDAIMDDVEPMPGTVGPVYRWQNDVLEVQTFTGGWTRESLYPSAGNLDVLRHALDLCDRPTRTEAVPVDPDDPWGEG